MYVINLKKIRNIPVKILFDRTDKIRKIISRNVLEPNPLISSSAELWRSFMVLFVPRSKVSELMTNAQSGTCNIILTEEKKKI